MAWAYLLLAILFEVTGTTSMKLSGICQPMETAIAGNYRCRRN